MFTLFGNSSLYTDDHKSTALKVVVKKRKGKEDRYYLLYFLAPGEAVRPALRFHKTNKHALQRIIQVVTRPSRWRYASPVVVLTMVFALVMRQSWKKLSALYASVPTTTLALLKPDVPEGEALVALNRVLKQKLQFKCFVSPECVSLKTSNMLVRAVALVGCIRSDIPYNTLLQQWGSVLEYMQHNEITKTSILKGYPGSIRKLYAELFKSPTTHYATKQHQEEKELDERFHLLGSLDPISPTRVGVCYSHHADNFLQDFFLFGHCNCACGSFLICAIMSELGLGDRVVIVSTADHIFLMLRDDLKDNNYFRFETTAPHDPLRLASMTLKQLNADRDKDLTSVVIGRDNDLHHVTAGYILYYMSAFVEESTEKIKDGMELYTELMHTMQSMHAAIPVLFGTSDEIVELLLPIFDILVFTLDHDAPFTYADVQSSEDLPMYQKKTPNLKSPSAIWNSISTMARRAAKAKDISVYSIVQSGARFWYHLSVALNIKIEGEWLSTILTQFHDEMQESVQKALLEDPQI
jgi:hypothetical protein